MNELIKRLHDLERRLAAVERTEIARPSAARAKTAVAQSIPNGVATIVQYNTIDFDPDGAITPGAGWRYTAVLTGYYHVDAAMMFQLSTAWAAGETAEFNLFKNGVFISCLGRNDSMSSGATGQYNRLSGSDVVALVATDYIDLRITQTSGGTLTLHSSANYNFVGIYRVH